MTDNLKPEQRSKNMAAVRARNTAPELMVRSIVHELGFRFRLHSKMLPGKPDLVFPRLKRVIFVHGCFWHRHPNCPRASTPATRTEFWDKKFVTNVERDRRAVRDLHKIGWKVLVVWQCELRDLFALRRRLERFLGG
jgi:DNA mismatch endonuclease (patch repair protein)